MRMQTVELFSEQVVLSRLNQLSRKQLRFRLRVNEQREESNKVKKSGISIQLSGVGNLLAAVVGQLKSVEIEDKFKVFESKL